MPTRPGRPAMPQIARGSLHAEHSRERIKSFGVIAVSGYPESAHLVAEGGAVDQRAVRAAPDIRRSERAPVASDLGEDACR